MNEEVGLLLGIPFGAPGYTPGANFKLIPCPDCQRSMWLGPQQHTKMTEGAKAQCLFCLAKEHGPEVLKNVPIKSLVADSGSVVS